MICSGLLGTFSSAIRSSDFKVRITRWDGNEFSKIDVLSSTLFLIICEMPILDAIYASYADVFQAETFVSHHYRNERFYVCLSSYGFLAIQESVIEVHH